MFKVFSSLVLGFLLFVASSHAANKVVGVGELCKQTKNPSFCLGLLNSNPGGKDLVSLGQYTIDVVRANATNTITLLKSLVAKSGRDPKANAHYKKCLEHFESDEGVLGDIQDTQEALKSGDYLGVNVHASALLDEVDDCISGESPGESPFPDRSLLPKYGGVMQQITSIILVISKYLAA
ncbi:pectinesterase inhibitor 1-like [Lotus japonicus]|uniref:pectinesterase inhibitor 1-like n=1 Tax=Lotus japonicus TaxID=34305 RepID=UPI0025900346|nr:pectinesterase inhibitor 1-like [Lotus japonicus]